MGVPGPFRHLEAPLRGLQTRDLGHSQSTCLGSDTSSSCPAGSAGTQARTPAPGTPSGPPPGPPCSWGCPWLPEMCPGVRGQGSRGAAGGLPPDPGTPRHRRARTASQRRWPAARSSRSCPRRRATRTAWRACWRWPTSTSRGPSVRLRRRPRDPGPHGHPSDPPVRSWAREPVLSCPVLSAARARSASAVPTRPRWCRRSRPGVFTECYRKDEERAQKLLTRVSEAWGRTTCLQLALEAKAMKFVSHGGIQVRLPRGPRPPRSHAHPARPAPPPPGHAHHTSHARPVRSHAPSPTSHALPSPSHSPLH